LNQAGETRLTIFNLMGQTVRTLLEGEMPAGERVIVWDGRDDAGKIVPGGTYYYRLQSNGQAQTKGLMFLK
jgi:flagellar hook assembly protein FlgD